METKNLNECIIAIRVDLQDSKIEKSGKNPFARYGYFELKDFLPKLNELMLKYGVNDIITIENDCFVLKLIKNDQTNEYKMPFTLYDTPLTKKGEKSMQDIQYLGALTTYYKRYLYMNAFGITDGEVIDSMDNNDLTMQNNAPKYSTHGDKPEREAIKDATKEGLTKVMRRLENDENKQYKAVVMKRVCEEFGVDKWFDIKFDKKSYQDLILLVSKVIEEEKQLEEAGV